MNGVECIVKWKVKFLSLEHGCATPEIPAGDVKNHEKQRKSGLCLGRFQMIAADIFSFDSTINTYA